VEKHPRASVFHTPGWLDALRRTYGYEPFVLTTSPPAGELANGMVFCRVASWITGHRIVSVPFTDHCEPLVDDRADLARILEAVRNDWEHGRYMYVELRPLTTDLTFSAGPAKADSYCFHRLDLRPSPEALFHGLHAGCVRRKIRRAEREGVTYAAGRSDALLKSFYGLMVSTRRNQRLPPQPVSWFRNLIACLGDRLTIHVASQNGQPAASILTLRHQRAMVYKYGCSDQQHSRLGGTQLLFWNAIQQAKQDGCEALDLGRSEWSNYGLIRFKDRLGAPRSALTYWRYGEADRASAWGASPLARWVFGHMPNALLTATGSLLYKHVG
jgi:CelD/BcsL family acetyltransferase involved in cellulose biosynthesis